MKINKILLCILLTFSTLSSAQVFQPSMKKETKSIRLEPTIATLELYIKNEDYPILVSYAETIGERIQFQGGYAILQKKNCILKMKDLFITPLKKVQDEKLKEIERLMGQGDQLLYELRPKEAIRSLNQAKEMLEEIIENLSLSSEIRKDFFTTQMLLARSHLDSGNEEKAREILIEIIKIYDNEFNVSEKEFHPKLVRLFNATYKEAIKQKNASLKINSTPNSCELLLNGRLLEGKTERIFSSLFPGSHHIQVKCNKIESMIHKINLENEKVTEITIDVDFENSLRIEEGHFGLIFDKKYDLKTKLPLFSKKIGAILEVDKLLLIGMEKEKNTYQLFVYLIDAKTGTIEKERRINARNNVVSPSTVSEIVNMVTGKEVIVVKKKAWYKNWIGWGATGVGVIGLTVGTIYLTKYFEYKDHATDPDWGTFEERVDEANKGNTARNVSGVFYVIGAAGVAGGVLLFILMNNGEKAPESAHNILFAPTISPYGLNFTANLRF